MHVPLFSTDFFLICLNKSIRLWLWNIFFQRFKNRIFSKKIINDFFFKICTVKYLRVTWNIDKCQKLHKQIQKNRYLPVKDPWVSLVNFRSWISIRSLKSTRVRCWLHKPFVAISPTWIKKYKASNATYYSCYIYLTWNLHRLSTWKF